MKILAIDSSAKTASVAVTEGGRLISECFVNAALTHSRTLMPMVDNALTQADMSFADIDALSVNVGPGSFTGIRIGVASVAINPAQASLLCSQPLIILPMTIALSASQWTLAAIRSIPLFLSARAARLRVFARIKRCL